MRPYDVVTAASGVILPADKWLGSASASPGRQGRQNERQAANRYASLPDRHSHLTTIRYIIFFFLTVGLFSGCDPCEKTTKHWKDDAISALTDLKNVTEEISNHSGIFNPPKFNKKDLYLDIRVYEDLPLESKNNLPLLRQWFKHTGDKEGGRNYISLKDETVSADFKSCRYKSISYDAYLFYSKEGIRPAFTKNLRKITKLQDSLDLGDNWYYILLRCDGCGD